MTILEIFEKVNLTVPIEQRKFFNYYDDTVTELCALYDGFVFEKGEKYTPPNNIEKSKNYVLPLYSGAVVDNILYLAGAGEVYKSEFLRKSKLAYNKYWYDNAKGRRMKRAGW